jgi:sugar phosphate isomerase/epimerase
MERKYGLILGNLGNTRDRFCSAYKKSLSSLEMLKEAARVPHVTGIELVGTWDIRRDNLREMHEALRDHDLKCISVIPDLFANPVFSRGSYCSNSSEIRRKAIDYTKEICDMAMELNCPLINVWPGQDGYDYLLCADYELEINWISEALFELASSYSGLSFSLEYKCKEPRTHSYLARMADTLLMATQTGLPNVGITIDTGHAFIGGEVIGEAIVLAKRAGNRLFHLHFNDNYTTTDDDMIVGSVHTVAYIETLYWLDRCGYDGWLSMDQYPYREDAAGAIGESILWLTTLSSVQDRYRTTIDNLVKQQDAVATSKFLRSFLLADFQK